ncbi:unnamed protein product [Didymodactylos carnosus]|uniref:Uncharacterized protein n=1 Tax=Didymodactylos carnosus TaxID=1234261 RepID=A0A814GAT2_9BILA|nr:unnamed protein product [Didymodactylos carnosus]CAF0993972.1 unnamed protein product [Didymodactylos carnosus]CAF3665412.1 unnamed protein product [Didymodactylos carnosus]CAF3765736.1 unnamed protein product [Didymodactylos carnosus]
MSESSSKASECSTNASPSSSIHDVEENSDEASDTNNKEQTSSTVNTDHTLSTNDSNPFGILSMCLPLNSSTSHSSSSSSKILHPQSYSNHRYVVHPYPISPQAYFANMAKYTETQASLAAATQAMNAAIEQQQRNQPQTVNSNNKLTGLTCAVCSDISSGKHYGILACNGCSGFFKRSVRRKLIYRCQANTGMCVVDKAHRNQCQACRLKKCMQMGMIKEAVQNERQPRNSAQVRPDSVDFHCDGTTISVMHSNAANNNSNIISSPQSGKSDEHSLQSENSFEKNSSSYDRVNYVNGTASSNQRLVTTIMDNALYGNQNIQTNDSVYAIAAQILLMIVRWIKHLPTFSSLPFRDQIILLEESWSELFLLWAIQCSLSIDGGPLFTNQECINDKVLFRTLNDLLYRFKQLKLDPIEFACLKAIILFRAETKSLKEPKIVENLQDQAQITLSQHTQLHHPTQQTRFGRLLLILPLLRSIPSSLIEKIYFSRIIGNTPMEKLLSDMFKN